MGTTQFAAAYTAKGWIENAVIATDEQGKITSIESVESVAGEHSRHWLIPGFISAHSHAFQYAMAGTAETLGTGGSSDDFWSWREAMYALALTMTPEKCEAIASMLYGEMLRHGITHVCEFHYIHHTESGAPYPALADMSVALMEAAKKSGINLCLIPVYYETGDFGKAPSNKQRRFVFKSADEYFRLVEAVEKAAQSYGPAVAVGVGLHSLRAAPQATAKRILSERSDLPAHVHIAEQKKEVEGCIAAWGKRPVEWLLDNVELSSRHSLVHVTHTTESEINRLAKTGAVSVICPATEGNLGDGFFRMREYFQANGQWAIGTDSQISLSPLEDLRWLDYQQRLQRQQRNTLVSNPQQQSGDLLFNAARKGGALSFGLRRDDAADIAVGNYLNAIAIDADHPLFVAKKPEQRLSTLIFSGDVTCFAATFARGKVVIKKGQHEAGHSFLKNYREKMR